MDDELEFLEELDREAERRGGQEISGAIPDRREADTRSDGQPQEAAVEEPGPDESSMGATLDEESMQQVEATQAAFLEQPDVAELESVLGEVTRLGFDEDVLGREGMEHALREAEKAETRGESYIKAFADSAEQQIVDRLGERFEASAADDAGPADAPDRDAAYRERYETHRDAYESRYENAQPWPRDSIDAYHRMAMNYNAYKAGESMGGVEVGKVDVFLSGVRFYQSNIIETAVVRVLRAVFDDSTDKQEAAVETEQRADVVKPDDGPLRDDVGAFDYGDATAASKEDVEAARQDIREYGYDMGIDTTRGEAWGSADNMRVFKPGDWVGKIDIEDSRPMNLPGMRLVEMGGNKALISPDGKVAFENSRFAVGDGMSDSDKSRIEARYDVFKNQNLAPEIERLAASRGMSVDELKQEYVEKAKEAYADGVERRIPGEVERLETRTIPQAREELDSYRKDLGRLERLESVLDKVGGTDAEVQEVRGLKYELEKGISKLEGRISDMEARVDLLKDTYRLRDFGTVEDRFTRAATSEEQAVGRAGRIGYVPEEVDNRVVDWVDAGAERVAAYVEAYNRENPEHAVSYDADSGEIFNKYGVSETGRFAEEYASVDIDDLAKADPAALEEYIREYADVDFNHFRDAELRMDAHPEDTAQDKGADDLQTSAEVEQQEEDKTEAPAAKDAGTEDEKQQVERSEQEQRQDTEVQKAGEVEEKAEADAADKQVEAAPGEQPVEEVDMQDTDNSATADKEHEEARVEQPDSTPADVGGGIEEDDETEAPDTVVEDEAESPTRETAVDRAELDETPMQADVGEEEYAYAELPQQRDMDQTRAEKEQVEADAEAIAAGDADIDEINQRLADTASGEDRPVDKYTAGDDTQGENDGAEYEEKVKDILETALNEPEELVSIESDVLEPMLDLNHEYGKDDFEDVFQILSSMIAGQDDAFDKLGVYQDIVAGLVDAADTEMDALDAFSEAMQSAGVPEDFASALEGAVVQDSEAGAGYDPEMVVRIGETELSIGENGIFDAITGDALGGFATDPDAENYLEDVDRSLYESSADIPDASAHVDIDQHDLFGDTSIPETLGELDYADADGLKENRVETGGTDEIDIPGVEAAVDGGDIAGAVEGAELLL